MHLWFAHGLYGCRGCRLIGDMVFSMTIMRGECKTPGGKLVGVNVTFDELTRRVVSCHLDGDFFIEGDDSSAHALIADIEQALVDQQPLEAVIESHPQVQLVGTHATAIATAFNRAVLPITTRTPADWVTPVATVTTGTTVAMDTVAAANTAAAVRKTVVADTAEPAVVEATTSNSALVNDSEHHTPDGDEYQSSNSSEYIPSEWRARWRHLHPTVILDCPRLPQEQMDIDEQWARDVAAGKRSATIRFWQWAAPAVVVGRFQSIPDEVHEDVAAREGFAVVRRCTGGGAMFIEPGNTITYSLYAPRDFVADVSNEASYRLCDMWLVSALRDLGLDVRFGGLNDIASQHGKIGGAAQRRFPSINGGPGAVLHHVTLAYDIDAVKMMRVLNTSREKMSDKAVKSVVKHVDPLRSQTGLCREEIIDRLMASLERGTWAV